MKNKTNKLISIIALIAVSMLLVLFLINNNEDIDLQPLHNESIYVSTEDLKKTLDDFYEVEPQVVSILLDSNKTKSLKKITKLNTIDTLMKQFTGESSFSDLDKAMVAFLKDNTISRIDKINGLWMMVEKFDISTNKGLYVLDSLATLLPIELTENLIAVYNEQTDLKVKAKVMEILSSSLNIANPEVQDEERLNFIISKYKEVESFFHEETMNSIDGKVSMDALGYYVKIVPPEDAFEIFESLKNGELKAKNLNKGKLLSLMTETALSTDESQKSLFSEILDSAKDSTLDKKEKSAFNQTLIEALNYDVLTEESREKVKSYIDEIEPSFASEVIKIDASENYYAWVNAKAKVEGVESNKYLESLVLESEDSLKISSILLYSDNNLIQNLKENEGNEQVLEQLNASLESNSVDEESKYLIKDALLRLTES